jgi:putative hemolysin
METLNWTQALKYFVVRSPHYMKLKGGRFLPAIVKLQFENATYEVKTIDHVDELDQVLRLRFEVFFNEFATFRPPKYLMPYDIDGNDFKCDHLIVKEKRSGKIIACYRLISSQRLKKGERYYTESEFNLDDFLKIPGNKLELGRACVHKDHRSGIVVRLLWRGLCEYAAKTQTKYMFGCSSVGRKDFGSMPSLMKSTHANKAFLEDYQVIAQPDFALKHFPELNVDMGFDPNEITSDKKHLNSLLNMYILAGAKVGKDFAYDEEMDCIDIFTVIDFNAMNPAFDRRFDNGQSK